MWAPFLEDEPELLGPGGSSLGERGCALAKVSLRRLDFHKGKAVSSVFSCMRVDKLESESVSVAFPKIERSMNGIPSATLRYVVSVVSRRNGRPRECN